MEYRLDELFELQMGKTPSRSNIDYWNLGCNKWISITDLSRSGKYIQNTKEYISDKAVKESGISQIPENTVIMSFKLSIGKTAITAESMYSNEAIMSFRDKHVVELIPDYIYYMFINKDWNGGTNKAVMGKTLNKVTLSQTKINIHGIQQQRQIVKVLDKVSEIIATRKAELDELECLIKARFVEMFGDPISNPKNWNTAPLDSICNVIVDCPHSTPSYTKEDTGFMCIRTSTVKKNQILWNEVEFIPEIEFIQRIQRKKPEKGDIIYTREGAILGIAAVIDRECNVALGQRSMLLSPNLDKTTPEFLSMAMNCDSFLYNALKGQSGSASPHINVGDIKAFCMIVPPIDLQTQFAAFVAQVDKSKVAVQKSLDEVQLLFDSLMQRYFG